MCVHKHKKYSHHDLHKEHTKLHITRREKEKHKQISPLLPPHSLSLSLSHFGSLSSLSLAQCVILWQEFRRSQENFNIEWVDDVWKLNKRRRTHTHQQRKTAQMRWKKFLLSFSLSPPLRLLFNFPSSSPPLCFDKFPFSYWALSFFSLFDFFTFNNKSFHSLSVFPPPFVFLLCSREVTAILN